MAGGHLAARDFPQCRPLDLADVLGCRAARMEAAARWNARWARHIALEYDTATFAIRIGFGCSGAE